LTEAGTYEAHLLTEAGCDSLVTLKLTVLEKKETTLEETICKGENFTFGGKLLTEEGTYEDHLLSQSGCDSLVTLKLTVLEKVETEIEESICEGESYTFNGKTLTDTGIYEELLTSTVGCDSLVKLKLTVLRKSHVTISDTIKLSRIYKKNGFDIDNAQIGENIFEKTWHNHWGCDSIVTLNLYVESRAFDTTYISICEGEELTWRGIDCSSAGKYETTTTTADSEMDSLHVLIVNHYPKLELDERYEMKVCYGTTTEFSEICSDDYTFQWTPSDNLSSTSVCNPKIQAKVDSIQYKVYVSNERCRDSFLVDVYASEGPSIQETNYDVQNDEYTVVAIGGEPEYTYSWEDGPWQTTAEYQKKYTPKPTLVRVRDSHGCEAKSYAAIYLPIIPAEYMSPNGDGIRDTWEIKNLTYYSTYTVKIYDRYGKLLIKYVNEYPGWDGIYMGVRMPSTDYWYTISVDEIDKEYVGHFTLLR
ncbi:MAG: T9SS type B sorting domain-containing protein, partial [Paludibacteraceae bacterium]|nr:T9SS type B sorting domain-containing protein [Paludibacteraceae bacterium]